jgi:N-acylglucosamine 2-epimerase
LGRECAPLIESTFASAAKNLNDPEFKDLFHLSWAPERKQHGPYMIALNTFLVAGKILGKERVGSLISECARRILYVFARDEHKLLFESVGRDDAVLDTAEGRLINPGHGLESMWFCIEAGRVYNEPEIINRAVEVSEWLYNCGHDREFGGILSFLDAKNNEPPQMDWHRESRVQWDDKVWWAHAESLCALAHAWSASGDNIWLGRFMDLHDWCQKNFFDPEFKEWYSALARDGTVKVSDKGSCWKAAYHLPRALMKITLLLENHTHAVPDAAERE